MAKKKYKSKMEKIDKICGILSLLGIALILFVMGNIIIILISLALWIDTAYRVYLKETKLGTARRIVVIISFLLFVILPLIFWIILALR